MKALILSLAGAALLAACGQPGEYYEKTPDQVAAALKAVALPTHILGEGIQRSRVTQPDPNTVITALLAPDGSEALRFVTTISPDGSGSRVLTEVRAPEGENRQRATELMASQAELMTLMEGLANEHVAAAIEGRPFDMTFAADALTKGVLATMPGMQQQIDSANAAAAAAAAAAQSHHFEEDTSAMGEASMDGSAMDSGLPEEEAQDEPVFAEESSEPAFGAPMDDAKGSE